MSVLLQVLAESGVDETLDELMKSSEAVFERNELENLFQDHGATSPSELIDSLLHSNVLQAIGQRFGLSDNGRKLSLLISAIDGANIEDVFRRLRRIDGHRLAYELVRQGMTNIFFDTLITNPGFSALYVCSPWINPTDKDIARLKYAMIHQERRNGERPELLVITRPPEIQPPGIESGLASFRELSARIYYHKRLHSKLYIREPDPSGGVLLAMVGSENLTRSNYLELGIMINGDDQIVNQLIRHFVELANISEEE